MVTPAETEERTKRRRARPETKEGKPTNLNTPGKPKATTGAREGKKPEEGKMKADKSKTEATEIKEDARKTNDIARTEPINRPPGPTHEVDRGEDGSPSSEMPGGWGSSPTESLDPTPIQGLTSPRRDLLPETVSAVRDELTIGFIANEVPMEPELSPEPEEATPTATEDTQNDKELEEEMLRQVAEDSKRQGEADLKKEEEEMLRRVMGGGKRGGKKDEEPEEEGYRKAKGRELGGKAGKAEEKRLKGLCDLCKESERVGGNGEVGDCKGKTIERSDWGEEGWREAGIQVTAEKTGKADKVATRVPEQKAGESRTRDEGKKEEDQILINAPKGPKRPPRFCNGWREAGIEPTVPETPVAEQEILRRNPGQIAGGTREQERKKEDEILINAPNGPKRLPRFCNLCKIYGHNDLTCHLQGNAPTPGPSRYQKPFKTLQQRTPRRGLGAPRGRLDIPTKKGELELELELELESKSGSGKKANRGIIFKKEEKPTPLKRKMGSELKLEPTKPDTEPKGTGELELELELAEKEEGEEKKESGASHPGGAEPRGGEREGGREPEAKEKKGKGTEREPRAGKPEKGKQGELEHGRAGGEVVKQKIGGLEEAGDGQLLKIHLSGCRAPPTATAKGREMEWKRSLRSKVEAALRKADPGAQSSVLGTSYHFSKRNEKVVTVRVRNWTSKNQVQHIVLGAVSMMEQNWTIKCAIIADWVEVVVEEVDGREKGSLASKRAEEIARANGWTLAQRAPQWIGQNRNFDTYEGSPTGLAMTIIRRNGEPPAMECVDSPYLVYGKQVNRKMKIFPLVRDGPHNFYINEEGSKVSSRASEHGPYAPPQWSPYKGRNACRDCGDWRHQRCGQNKRLPVCNICQGLHLDRECPRGTESREDMERRRREVEKLRREKQDLEERLRTVEGEMDTRYPKGVEQDRRKHHGNGETKGGKSPQLTNHE